MRARRVLDVVFGVLVASVALYALFPRFRNDLDCTDSVPANSAQSAALSDARARRAGICRSSQQRCKFGLDEDPDGSLRVSVYFVDTNLFEGCVFKDQDFKVFIYSRTGEFVRVDEGPYE